MNLNHLGSRLAAALLVAGLVFGITSCGSSSSRMRYVVADQTYNDNVDILIDNRIVATNRAYGTGTAYMGVSSGGRVLEVRPTGNTNSSSDLVHSTISVQGGSDTTVILDYSGGSTSTPYTDVNTQPPSGSIEIRPIHAANFLGNLDVYIIPQGQGISGVSPQVSNLAFNSTAKNYVKLNAGTWEVVFTFAGTQSIAFDTGTSIPSLSSGAIRTVVALNAVNGSPGYTTLTDR